MHKLQRFQPQLLLKTIDMEKFWIYFPYLPRFLNNVSIDDVLEDRIDHVSFCIPQASRFGGPLGKLRETALCGAQVGFQPAQGKKTGLLGYWETWETCGVA